MVTTRLDRDAVKKQSSEDEAIMAEVLRGKQERDKMNHDLLSEPKAFKPTIADRFQASAACERPTANCDVESSVKARIMTAIRAANFVGLAKRVGADEHIINCAIEGIANGAAVEILRDLGFELEFVNLRKPPIAMNLEGKLYNL
jgi:hypothetical protein